MDNSKDWGEFLEGIKAAQQATEAQKEANEQHEKYERLRFEFTLALINNNDLLHERSFKEICQLGVELTDEFMKHESETEPYVYAILDDDRSMLAEQRKYFIKTNTVTGITDEDARHVINILNRNDMWNDKLNSLIMESMKNHDAVRTTVLRAIKTEFSNYATAKNAKPLDNAAEVAIIKKLRDQRIDNAEQYRMAGRQDLYDNEMAESLILNEFLPEVPDDKVLALGLVEVCALQGCEDGPKIPKSKMGIIIKELKAMFPAADGKQIADLVKSCVV